MEETPNASRPPSQQEVQSKIQEICLWVCRMLASRNYTALKDMKNAILKSDTDLYDASIEERDTDKGASMGHNVEVFWSRLLIVMDIAHKASSEKQCLNQREVYYQVKSQECFSKISVKTLNNTISSLCIMTGTPKWNLGIITSPKGYVYGRLKIRDKQRQMKEINCLEVGGYHICGNPNVIQNFVFTCSAKCIIVIEKETIFQKLMQLGIMDKLYCILITGKGYPDVATRCFLKHLSDANRCLPVYSLVDCNPDGLCISNTYKFGSPASFVLKNMQPFAVNQLKWLGILPSEAYASKLYTKPNFTRRDAAMMKKIKQDAERNQVSAQWMNEVYIMESAQHKVDIEHFSRNCNLADYVSKIILTDGGLAR